jgi:hypothetical protein
MMNRDAFWKIIETSVKLSKGDVDAQIDILEDEARKLSVDEVINFSRHFDDLWIEAYRWDLWGAAYLIGGGCSDDGFMDFRAWLVSRGREVYEAALKNPESLANVLGEDEEGQIEGFQYVASKVWAEKTGGDPIDFPDNGSLRPPNDPVGESWTEDDLPRLFPKLWKKFGSDG